VKWQRRAGVGEIPIERLNLAAAPGLDAAARLGLPHDPRRERGYLTKTDYSGRVSADRPVGSRATRFDPSDTLRYE
jgi:hypothetical protein